jgi:DNA adenine methylase
MLSPLRYPGSKADLVPVVAQIFTEKGLVGTPLVEPYAGSASVSLCLVEAGISPSAIIGEQDPLIYCFWRAVFENTDELLERFIDLKINLETWHQLRPMLQVKDPNDVKDLVGVGLAGLFFNRANFSGILNGGPIGGMKQLSAYKIDCRTNKDEIIARILAISTLHERISVHFGDAVSLIQGRGRRTKEVLYVDPPYYLQGENLYRYFYRLQDHKRLAEALERTKAKWLVSYDDHHVIEFLYEKFHIRRHAFRYSARSPKQHNELLISNFDLPTHLEGWKVVA